MHPLNFRFLQRSIGSVAIPVVLLSSHALAITSDIQQLPAQSFPPLNQIIYDGQGQPITAITSEPIYSVQGNLAVGPQNVIISSKPTSTLSVNIQGEALAPGQQVAVKVEAGADGKLVIPFHPQVQQQGTFDYTVQIAQVASTLDMIPTLQSGSVSLAEGNSGTQVAEVTLTLDIHAGHPVSVDYITRDVSAQSRAGEAKNLAYDAFGNPFISAASNPLGGRLVFDGGFPKFYSAHLNNASHLQQQFGYLTNVYNWIRDPNRAGGVLLLGDSVGSTNYTVKGTRPSDFKAFFTQWASTAGTTLTIRDSNDFGGVGNATVPLDFLEQFSAVIVMGSNYSYGASSFTEQTNDNFAEYSIKGGGIMLITDHHGFQYSVNGIAEKFGARFYGNVNRAPVSVSYLRENYGDHPLWNNLETIHAGGSEGNIDITGVSTTQVDYEAQAGTVVFDEGETIKTIQVTVLGDTIRENDETFSLEFSNPDKLNLPSETTTVTIKNND
ncbi:Calx-beta domain-containing protein [uncultured Photobacterium sp.]|uniref:Calx-beta domain-containing protein n=1 Tax=uncultured Photobacterium sp. TaxID=173973 RepID=UPI00261B9ACC|nr:Calx-beta domain-containing protein [uncultured Photobacterium sp.]